jgi:hypothetical protein
VIAAMTASGKLDVIKGEWRAQILNCMTAMPSCNDALLACGQNRETPFCVLLGIPEKGSPMAVWGTALVEIFCELGIDVIPCHVNAPRLVMSKHQAQADMIIMLGLTSEVLVESIFILQTLGNKLVICLPTEEAGGNEASILSQTEFKAEVVGFSRAALEGGTDDRMALNLFVIACDRMLKKHADNRLSLRVARIVVILVHGILSFGAWYEPILASLKKAGLLVEMTDPGFISPLAFWLPIPWLRNRPASKVWKQIVEVKKIYPERKICILAHSFGTFIISRIFKQEPTFVIDQLAMCGSIIPPNFQFPIAEGRCREIINEVGRRDFWPALTKSVTWGYGNGGTYGARSVGVKDRWHDTIGHTDFLSTGFCDKYWVSFFKHQEITHSGAAQVTPFWIQMISYTPLKYISLALIIALVILR